MRNEDGHENMHFDLINGKEKGRPFYLYIYIMSVI
jgi:hypothetical protein